MADLELDFANDARAAASEVSQGRPWLLLAVIAAMLAGAVLWAANTDVGLTATGIGRVIPSSQVQLVQSLEPGIVAKISARTGDRVTAGQELVQIDATGSLSELGELHQQELALTAEFDRLNAQTRGEDAFFVLPETIDKEARLFYADQLSIFEAEQQKLKEQALVRRQQLEQRRQNLREGEATARKQAESLRLMERELELMRSLFEKKAVPEIEYLRIQRTVAELRGDLDIWEASRERLKAEISESTTLLEAEQSAFLADVRARISRTNAQLSVVRESLKAASDRVRRTVLRAPVDGIVNKLTVASIGEVIQAGVNVAEVVPVDDTLLIETRIRPQDVAFIKPGAAATIRLTAYDYTKFGTLAGTVERIGADTIADADGDTYYQVIVRADFENFASDERRIQVIPGMVATVDISNGSRTILEYLVRPILKIRDQALREPR